MEKSQSPEQVGKPLKIIYIEDQQGLVDWVKGELAEQEGVKLSGHFLSVEEAEKYLDSLSEADMPDVIVTDNNLGAGKKGLDFAKERKNKKPKIAVILVSGGDSTLGYLMKLSPEKLRDVYGLAGVLDKSVMLGQKCALTNLIREVALKVPPRT